MKSLGTIDYIALILLIIGGLNWGLVSIASRFDLVAMIFGDMTMLSRIVYGLVGLSAVYIIVMFKRFTHMM